MACLNNLTSEFTHKWRVIPKTNKRKNVSATYPLQVGRQQGNKLSCLTYLHVIITAGTLSNVKSIYEYRTKHAIVS